MSLKSPPAPGNHLSVRPSAYPPIGFFQAKSQPSTQKQLSTQIQAGCSPAKKPISLVWERQPCQSDGASDFPSPWCMS